MLRRANEYRLTAPEPTLKLAAVNYAQLVQHFGSEAEAVRALGIPQTTINAWKDGIPSWRQHQIEALTDGKLRASKHAKRNGQSAR